ncbi:MAG: hypothetical protein P9M07_03035 [Candidatus Aceula meridiana]|nr:hypothetical protein [Candidatus Aceula meridiana]
MNSQCRYCQNRHMCQKEDLSWIFVAIGFISTVAIRIVTILMNISPFWGKFSWYLGVVGFIAFFAYKYRVFVERARIIRDQQLLEKLSNPEKLEEEDYHAIALMLCKIRAHKERINFLFIFVISFLSLILAVYFDFIA